MKIKNWFKKYEWKNQALKNEFNTYIRLSFACLASMALCLFIIWCLLEQDLNALEINVMTRIFATCFAAALLGLVYLAGKGDGVKKADTELNKIKSADKSDKPKITMDKFHAKKIKTLDK